MSGFTPFHSTRSDAVQRNERIKAHMVKARSDAAIDLECANAINTTLSAMLSDVDISIVHPLDAAEMAGRAVDALEVREGAARWVEARIEHYTGQPEAQPFIYPGWARDQATEASRIRSTVSDETNLRRILRAVARDEVAIREENSRRRPVVNAWTAYSERAETAWSTARSSGLDAAIDTSVWPLEWSAIAQAKAIAALKVAFEDEWWYDVDLIRERFRRLTEMEDHILEWLEGDTDALNLHSMTTQRLRAQHKKREP